MIADLDETLRQLLIAELPVRNGEIEIKFDQPAREWSARLTRPALNLFLYDVRENSTLRQHQWQQMGNGGPREAARKRTPYRVDCTYLITAWAAEPEDEHRLLSRVLMALFRYPILPEEQMVGMMQGQPFEVQTKLASPERLTNPAEIWSALDNETRPTVPYTVTLALDPWAEVTDPLVRTAVLHTHQSLPPFAPAASSVFIGGTVRDQEGQPRAGVTVALKDTGYLTTTGDDGRYVLGALPPGEYVLVCWPETGKPREQPIRAGDGDGNYDVEW
jgi:hypothetical protein